MKHIPFLIATLGGIAGCYFGYTGDFQPYTAWLIGVCGSFSLYVTAVTWATVRATPRSRGVVMLIIGAASIVAYVPAHVAFSEALQRPALRHGVQGNMEAVFFIAPTILGALLVFREIRHIAERSGPNQSVQPTRTSGPQVDSTSVRPRG